MQLKDCFEKALEASRELNCVSASKIDRTLTALADAAEKHTDEILEANREDLARMEPSDPMYDRLLLNRERIAGIAADIRNVASLPSPLGKILSETVRPNGMKITKVSVPFGVIGVIYEARPNVGFDVFSLCLKSGNACILKGGSDARCSNEAIVRVIREVLREQGLDENCVTLMPADRAATAELLNAVGYVDLIIPRGSKGLIDFVRQNAHVPVIETGAGICHTYFDRDGDLKKGTAIVLNAKTRRVSVCNARFPSGQARRPGRLMRAAGRQKRRYPCRRRGMESPERALSGGTAATGRRTQLRDGVPLLPHVGENGRLGRRGDPTHRALLVAAQRSHRIGKPGDDPAVLTAGRRRLRIRQRIDRLYGRRPVRPRSRNRDQHAEAACPRPYGASGADLLQIHRRRRRTNPRLTVPSGSGHRPPAGTVGGNKKQTKRPEIFRAASLPDSRQNDSLSPDTNADPSPAPSGFEFSPRKNFSGNYFLKIK